MYKNSSQRYGMVAQVLHWTVAAMIIAQFVLANIFSEMPLGMDKINLIVLHKSIGMTILMLAVVRLLWRFFNTQPSLPDSLKPYERYLAMLTHWGFYTLIFAMPLSGWIMSSLAGISVDYFGLFDFPSIIAVDKASIPISKSVHEILSILLVLLAVLHLLAVLKHQFILKDDVLQRMLPEFLTRK